MKKIVSALLSCSLLCSSTVFAAERNDTGVSPGAANTAVAPAKGIKPTTTVPKLTAQTALQYSLIPAGLGALGFVGLAVVGAVCHHQNKKTPANATLTKSSSKKDKKTSTNVILTTPQPQPQPRPATPFQQPYQAPYSLPLPQPQTIQLPRELDNDPAVSYVQASIYEILEDGLNHIANALAHEDASNRSYQLVQSLKKLDTKKEISYQAPAFQSERIALEKIRGDLTNVDVAAKNAPDKSTAESKITYLFDTISPAAQRLTDEAETKENHWKDEATKWQAEVNKLQQLLKDNKVSLPQETMGATIVDVNRHMPKPKNDTEHGGVEVKANGAHAVLTAAQFRQWAANVQGEIHILFRGSHFVDKTEATTYHDDFVNEGLLISTADGEKKAKGWDCYGNMPENIGRPGHAVYFSKNLREAFGYAATTDRYDKKTGTYVPTPIKRITLAALMPNCPKVKFYSGIYTGYPDVNDHFVLCSDFCEFESDSHISYNGLDDYTFDPGDNGDAKNVRKVQIQLLKAGIVIKQQGWSFVGTVDIKEADRLLKQLGVEQPVQDAAA